MVNTKVLKKGCGSLQLHLITDGKKTKEELVAILTEVHDSVDFIHVREKHRSANEIFELVDELIRLGVRPGKIIINDRVDVAHVLNVGGVQLAYHSLGVSEIRRSFPELRIGKSVHSYEEAIQAEMDGADFIMYGHIYTTSSKDGLLPKGLMELRRLTRSLKIPVIAIGGIAPDKLQELRATGAGGIAVMSGIMDAEDTINAAKAYQTAKLAEKEEIG
ncbi:transcriptional regulator [Bacillus sp. LL01]|uniref:thiazole tautomerase TenI n=1 Tax=Bacillus sp. LL01 TaxID=1665556 RepID=UPI00064D38A2|nr:thiazole tautomerase TenI [Bacillus sp. LL01]KMJ57962.1 transcriptional regulator [Bacillus sp. LL01]